MRTNSRTVQALVIAMVVVGCGEAPAPQPAPQPTSPPGKAQTPEITPEPVAEESVPAREEPPAERPAAEETAEEPVPPPAELASIRNHGVTRVALPDPAEGISKEAREFMDSLGTIRAAGSVEHPKESPRGQMEGAAMKGGRGGGGGAVRRMYSRTARAPGAPRPTGAVRGRALNAPMAAAAKAAFDSGQLGVTTGGMQDIGQARKIIDEGKIPSPSMFAAEALISEHDIALEGAPTGESELYASASVGWLRRYGRKEPMAIVQIGFGVDMNMDEFHRPALNLAVVVDVSGSMRGGKTDATKKALQKLIDQLGDKDRLAIVLFDHTAWVPMPSMVMDAAGVAAARAIVEKEVYARGSTNIAAGLRFGYEQVAAHAGEPGRSPRVFLMTDARPNTGDTSVHGFTTMLQGAAAFGIGLGAFGVGIDFGQDLAYKIFQTRNANYFFLENEEKIAKVFDEEFAFLVTPAAHDVLVMMVPADGAEIVDVMGVPDYEKGAEGAELRIPSLFFSKRQGGGATLVALKLAAPDFAGDVEVATVDLSFAPVGATKKVRQRIDVFLPAGLDAGGSAPYYSQSGVKKALMLAEMSTAMKTACAGQKAPSVDDTWWMPRPVGPAKRVRGGRPGYHATVSKEQAASAGAGLGAFCDWFASQAAGFGTARAAEVGFDSLEPELRLMEKLETTLQGIAGVPKRAAPREIPDVVKREEAPPALEIF